MERPTPLSTPDDVGPDGVRPDASPSDRFDPEPSNRFDSGPTVSLDDSHRFASSTEPR